MKNIIISLTVTLLLCISVIQNAQAQWSQNLTTLWTTNNNQKVGIGTATPQQKLDVNGDAKMNQLFLNKDFNGSDGGLTLNGNRPTIRLNSTETNQKWLLHVGSNYNGAFELFNSTNGNWGAAKFSIAPGTGDMRTGQILINKNFNGSDGGLTLNGNRPTIRLNSTETNQKWLLHLGSDYNGAFQLFNSTDGNWGAAKFAIAPGTGAVVIGTTKMPAGYKLCIGGKIICEELKVQLQSAWPDYVFEPAYKLEPLESVAKHIAEKGHLPNIPSACEVAENGISVGEMQTKMMEKIEELTLYLLDIKKENESLKERVQALETTHK